MHNTQRKKTLEVRIGNVKIGAKNPVAIQSMTNTPTADIEATFAQIVDLIKAGSEIVRVTVNDHEAAKAVPFIKEKLLKSGYSTPIVGDFHYNGHTLLTNHPDCASALDKYRINPGNVGAHEAREYNFKTMITCALQHKKPVRIGVNWGSLDQELFTHLMNRNGRLKKPKSYSEVLCRAMVQSALLSAKAAEKIGLPSNRIVLSAKVSDVRQVIDVYRMLSKKCDYPLHVGLTEAGMGTKGIVASVSALSVLLQEGIGDTIRVSLTPEPGHSRTKEVEVCQQILQTLGLRSFRPGVSSCPGCGRTDSDYYQKLAAQVNEYILQKMPHWKRKYPGVEHLKIAVMGCIVNGPGESKHADIGISLPGKTEDPVAPVYVDGKLFKVLKGNNIPEQFLQILETYIQKRFSEFHL